MQIAETHGELMWGGGGGTTIQCRWVLVSHLLRLLYSLSLSLLFSNGHIRFSGKPVSQLSLHQSVSIEIKCHREEEEDDEN